jgi:ARG/rhodanese/phosphatase superfamily protein
MKAIDASTMVHRLLEPGSATALQAGTPQTAGALTLVPLFHKGPALDYLLFAPAVAKGLVRVDEVGEGGSVPELVIGNTAPVPLLLIEGEIVIGLKQNRTFTASILVPAETTMRVPVACVESGRWHRSHVAAHSDDHLLSPQVRRMKSESVVREVRAHGSYAADQGAVWAGVEETLAGHGIASPTSAYSDVNRRQRQDIRTLLAGIRPLRGQTGVVAVLAGRPHCADVVDRPSTFRRMWRRIAGSYAADALLLDIPDIAGTWAITAAGVAAWLHALDAAETTVHPAVGLGSTVALTLADRTATALVAGGGVVHLTAFAAGGGQTELPW